MPKEHLYIHSIQNEKYTHHTKKGGANMDAKRAQEISYSQSLVSVSYNGDPVYIEHVDQSNGQVTIHPLDNPASKQSVSVTDLAEQ